MSDRIKFLISGPGLIGRRHAEIINCRKDADLTAIVHPTEEEHDNIRGEFECNVYTNVEEALSMGCIDAAIISSPNEFHFDQALACIDHKVPVLIEKPITENLDKAKKLQEIERHTNAVILVGHHRTYSPLLKTAKNFLTSNCFGRLVAVTGSALFYKPESYYAAGPWRSRIGGGPLLINMIHEIGIMRYLCSEISSVATISSNKTRGFEVEDTVAISIDFENGALGTFLLSDTVASNKSWEMTSGENTSYPFYPEDTCYHFAGTNGSLDFPNMAGRYYNSHSERSWWKNFNNVKLSMERSDPLDLQIQHFIDVVRGHERPVVTAYDGYRNLSVIDAIQRSIVTGRREVVR